MRHLVFVFVLAACSSDRVYNVQDGLQSYLDNAFSISTNYRKEFSYENIILKLTLDLVKNEKCYGKTTHTKDGQRIMEFDYNHWLTTSESKRQTLFLHEFGHCFLLKGHNSRLSLMNPDITNKGWPICKYVGSDEIDCDHTELINELFLGNAN